MNHEVKYKLLRECAEESATKLTRSERGRDVADALHAFLDGRISHLDGEGWEAVLDLLRCYRDGVPGTVLELLDPRMNQLVTDPPEIPACTFGGPFADHDYEPVWIGQQAGRKCRKCGEVDMG